MIQSNNHLDVTGVTPVLSISCLPVISDAVQMNSVQDGSYGNKCKKSFGYP